MILIYPLVIEHSSGQRPSKIDGVLIDSGDVH